LHYSIFIITSLSFVGNFFALCGRDCDPCALRTGEFFGVLKFSRCKNTFILNMLNWFILGSESLNILCFILFTIKRLRETTGDFQKKIRELGGLTGSPQYEHFLAQLVRFARPKHVSQKGKLQERANKTNQDGTRNTRKNETQQERRTSERNKMKEHNTLR
jgi:hypothetical protein